ncbi:GDSL esterase/lipase At3g26430-like [Bidens hawaiensis]|uniref:GDSL esterase/lipase At3g26430-like n=1 Tax=Bidens hawaiensis TaxID=980011 RepID=UPI00404AD5E5
MELMCKPLVLVTLLFPILAFALPECNFPAIFNFGDSNSDTGALQSMFGQNAAPAPNGETYFHFPAGRLCDGRLIIDFIAEDLDIPHLSPFLDSTGTNFSHGANYATIGSTIRRQNTTIFQSGYSPISLDVQYAEFNNFLTKFQIIRQKGDVFKNMFPAEYTFSSALYVFDIGQNDLSAGFQLNMSPEEVRNYIPNVISWFTPIIKKVYALGGRTFWIHNTGPVGCLPYILDTKAITAAQMDKHGCAATYNDVSQYFNQKLKEAVIQLRKDLPLAAITYVDIYSVKYSLVARSKELGFSDPFLVCCGYGGKYNFNNAMKCGKTKTVNGTKIVFAKSCEDPSSQINWDGTHYTETANKWVYSQIADGAYSDPPVPLKMACHRKEDLTQMYL